MKKSKFRVLISMILCLALMISAFSACGKSKDYGGGPEDNRGASSGEASGAEESSGEVYVNTDNDGGGEYRETPTGEASAEIYYVGTDKVAFVVTSDLCAKMLENSECHFFLDGGEASANLESEYSSFGNNINGEWKSAQTSASYGILFVGNNMFYCEMEGENIASIFPESGSYDLRFYDALKGDTISVGAGDFKDIKKITEEDYATDIKTIVAGVQVAEPAQANWDGIYITEGYSDAVGALTIEKLPGGLVFVSGEMNDEPVAFPAKEEEYEEASYDYGSYIQAALHKRNENGQIDISLRVEPEYTSFSYNFYNHKNGSSGYASLRLFGGSSHAAPEGYVDEDRYGSVLRQDPKDSEFFKPSTDDYMIRVYEKSSKYYGEQSEPCMEYMINSYDANEMLIDKRYKYVFDSAATAKKVYDALMANNYSTRLLEVSGEVLYEWYTDSYRDTKKENMGYNWYADCHFMYPYYINDDDVMYYYISKPYSDSSSSMTIEDMLFWLKVPTGAHHSFESADASLYLFMDSGELSISLSDYREDSMSNGIGTMRNTGREAQSIYYATDYDHSDGSEINYVSVKEFKFDEDKAYVTEYGYKVDSFDTVDITLDNYKSKTPDTEKQLTFDMKNAT